MVFFPSPFHTNNDLVFGTRPNWTTWTEPPSFQRTELHATDDLRVLETLGPAFCFLRRFPRAHPKQFTQFLETPPSSPPNPGLSSPGRSFGTPNTKSHPERPCIDTSVPQHSKWMVSEIMSRSKSRGFLFECETLCGCVLYGVFHVFWCFLVTICDVHNFLPKSL